MGVRGLYPHEKRGSGVPTAGNHSDKGAIKWGSTPNTGSSPESSTLRKSSNGKVLGEDVDF
eukprot:scaffold6374_cov121-Cylindrotheca_fusiformis.AAC.1